MKNLLILVVIALVFSQNLIAQTHCAEIESILVDACGTPEGRNEMFRFRIGANNLYSTNLTVTWSSNPWLGVCQDATTARDVAALNRTILNCGWLVEPVGGLLPAGRDVLFITSENLDTLANSFANLEDTLIVVFQCGSASSGHFRNYATGQGTRTTILSFSGPNGGSDTATYVVDQLVGQNGSHAVDDGASVLFTNSQPTSYYNNGCNAPVPIMTVQIITPDTTICKGGNISLRATAANYKNVKWSGGLGTFNHIDSLNCIYTPAANETYPFTLTIKAYKKCTGDSVSDAIVISKYSNATTAGSNVAICNGSSTTLTATGGATYVWDASPFLSCTNCATTAATPNSTTTFFATVTDNHTCVNRDSVIVTVNPKDSINVIASDTICSGGSAVLSAYSSNGFAWSPATNLTCTNCAAPTATPSSTTTYTLTSLGSCPAQKQVTVNVLLPNLITINNSAVAITCANPTVTLTATSTTNGLQYNWGSGINTATNTVNSGGSYTVTATDPLFGCTSTATAVVTQNTTTVNAGIAAHGSLSCTVSSIALNANSTTTGATYNWGSGNTNSTYTVSMSGSYTVTVTDPANGCSATATTNVTTSAGAVSITATSTNATCGISNGGASVSVSSGTSPYTYLWSNNGNAASISNLAAGTYSVTVNDAGGCSATASITITASNGLNINVLPVNTSCGLYNGAITVTPLSGNSPYTYTWSVSGSTGVLSNVPAGTYNVTVADANGCSATASAVINPSTVNAVTASYSSGTICSGDSAQICATSGFTTYLWNNGQTSACIYAKLAGNYYVTATDAAGCTAASNHVALNVHPQPPVSISVNGDTLTAYNSNTYQWYFNNIIITGATSPVYIANQNGFYTVSISDTNGCRASSLPVQIIISGIDYIEENTVFKIFPNPVAENGSWNLETSENLLGSTFELFDAEGKITYSGDITSTQLQINLNVAKGLYVLRIQNSKAVYSIKLVKQF